MPAPANPDSRDSAAPVPTPRPPQAVVVVGASAGGVQALSRLVEALPSDLPATVLVILHLSAAAPSALPTILDRSGALPAAVAEDGLPLAVGTVVVAPPDLHLTVAGGRVTLDHGPKVNGHRPAIDTTFSSVAAAYGPVAIGVLLSGMLDDGTRGLADVKAAGGVTLLQDPQETRYPGMVESALRAMEVDAILPIDELALEIVRRVRATTETEPATEPPPAVQEESEATRYTCPDCGGVLWRTTAGPTTRFVCSVGHAYSPAVLDQRQGEDVEIALWAAVRILGDRRELLAELAERADQAGREIGAMHHRTGAAEMERAAEAIRQLVQNRGIGTHLHPPTDA